VHLEVVVVEREQVEEVGPFGVMVVTAETGL